jgi:hypothetical protein
MSGLSAQDIASYDHSALFFVTNWQVIDVGYVASRQEEAERGAPHAGHPRRVSEKLKV